MDLFYGEFKLRLYVPICFQRLVLLNIICTKT